VRTLELGFTLIFKEVIYDGIGKPKGNCDADLVLRVARDTYENNFDQAIIITSDGDYASLVKFIQEKKEIVSCIVPEYFQKVFHTFKKDGS